MKKEYIKPELHFVPHIDYMNNKDISSMSDNELTEYVHKLKQYNLLTKYKTGDDYLLRDVAGESILVPLGLDDNSLNGMITVNKTFRFLWEQFSTPHTLYDVILTAKERFEGENIENSIIQFINESIRYGILKEEDEK